MNDPYNSRKDEKSVISKLTEQWQSTSNINVLLFFWLAVGIIGSILGAFWYRITNALLAGILVGAIFAIIDIFYERRIGSKTFFIFALFGGLTLWTGVMMSDYGLRLAGGSAWLGLMIGGLVVVIRTIYRQRQLANKERGL